MADDTTKVEKGTAEMSGLSFDPAMRKKKSSAIKKEVTFDPATAEVPEKASTAKGIPFFDGGKLIGM